MLISFHGYTQSYPWYLLAAVETTPSLLIKIHRGTYQEENCEVAWKSLQNMCHHCKSCPAVLGTSCMREKITAYLLNMYTVEQVDKLDKVTF